MKLDDLTRDELLSLEAELSEKFDTIKSENLALDLTRGKPSAEQVSLADELDGILNGFFLLQDGTDVRNYGGLLGIPEA